MKKKSKVDKVLFIIYLIGIALILAYMLIDYKYYPESRKLNPVLIFFLFSFLLSVISMVLQIKDQKPVDLLILILIIIGIAIYYYREGLYVWF